MTALEELIVNLQNQSIFELYLPFLLTFAIFFALIQKSKVFGDNQPKISALVAFIAGFYVMFYSPVGIEIGQFFAMFFAETSVMLVTLMVFLMIIALLTGPFLSKVEDWQDWGKKLIPLAIILGLLVSFGMFGSSGGILLFTRTLGTTTGIDLSSDDMVLIILIVATVGAIWWLVGGSKAVKSTREKAQDLLLGKQP